MFIFVFCFLVREISFAGVELTSQRVRGLRGTSELPGRPATHDCPVVHCQMMHQSRSRMASIVQLTYISAVKLVAGETLILCSRMQSINKVIPFLYGRLLS